MTAENKAGSILVNAGMISASVVEEALAIQKESGKRLLAVLEELGAITEEQWIHALASAVNFKIVDALTRFSFPPELLRLVPAAFAQQHVVFPLKMKEGKLALALSDPFDRATLDYLASTTGMKIIPFLSRQKDILAAISANYLKEPPDRCKKILVVEDSRSIASIIAVALQNEGYQVVVGYDGLEGLKLALAESPDLVITDTVMPGLDGFGLLRALRSNQATAKIPAILVTAKSGVEDEQQALEAGFLDFISKPVQPIRLVSRVKRGFQLIESMQTT